MSLLDFQIDLQETNRQLGRIADALERIAPAEPVFTTYTESPKGRRVSPTSPAAQWNETKRDLEQQGRYEEIVAGAYGPRSLRRE